MLLGYTDIKTSCWKSTKEVVKAGSTSHGCMNCDYIFVYLCLSYQSFSKIIGIRLSLRDRLKLFPSGRIKFGNTCKKDSSLWYYKSQIKKIKFNHNSLVYLLKNSFSIIYHDTCQQLSLHRDIPVLFLLQHV